MKGWADELSIGGTASAANLAASGDLTVGDDATVTGDLNVDGTFDADGPVDLSGADSIALPTNTHLVKRWVSAAITEASIVGGAAAQSIAFASFPTAIVPIAGYLIADEAATSGNGSTTTLTYALGVSGLTQGYLTAGANVLTASGRQANGTGVLFGGYRAADTLLLTITAGGGAPDVSHITNLQVRAVVYYVDVATE